MSFTMTRNIYGNQISQIIGFLMFFKPKISKRNFVMNMKSGFNLIKSTILTGIVISFRYFRLEKHQEANNLANLITVYVPCHGKRHKIINSFNYQFLTDFPEYQNLPKS